MVGCLVELMVVQCVGFGKVGCYGFQCNHVVVLGGLVQLCAFIYLNYLYVGVIYYILVVGKVGCLGDHCWVEFYNVELFGVFVVQGVGGLVGVKVDNQGFFWIGVYQYWKLVYLYYVVRQVVFIGGHEVIDDQFFYVVCQFDD